VLQHRATTSFWKNYRALAPEVQRRADKQFSFLKTDAQHPSLQFKKIGESGLDEVWSARVTLNHRALPSKDLTGFSGFGLATTKLTKAYFDDGPLQGPYQTLLP
jgi:hypothetical protein